MSYIRQRFRSLSQALIAVLLLTSCGAEQASPTSSVISPSTATVQSPTKVVSNLSPAAQAVPTSTAEIHNDLNATATTLAESERATAIAVANAAATQVESERATAIAVANAAATQAESEHATATAVANAAATQIADNRHATAVALEQQAAATQIALATGAGVPYTHLATCQKGATWVNILIAPGVDRDQLIVLARELHSKTPGLSYHIFDDAAQFKQYMDWDIHYPDDRYPYPEKWVQKHNVGNVQRMLDMNAVAKWRLVDHFGEIIVDLE